MIDFEYAARNIRGVWRMAFGGGDWRDDLDRSVDGVFRSFWAIALAAPFSLLAFVSLHRAAARSDAIEAPALTDAPLALLLATETTSFLLDWAASIAALVFTARALGAGNRTADVIAGFNWAQVITTVAVTAPIAVLGLTASAEIFSLLYLPAVIFALVLLWRVLRQCLPLDAGMAVALIAMLTVIGLVIRSAVTGGAVLVLQALS